MLNIRDLRIDPASLGAKKLLVDVAPAYEYKDGKRTDTVRCLHIALRKSVSALTVSNSWRSRKALSRLSLPTLKWPLMSLRAMFSSPQKPPAFLLSGKIDGRNRAARAQQTGNRYFPSRKISPGGSASAAPLPHGKYYLGAAR